MLLWVRTKTPCSVRRGLEQDCPPDPPVLRPCADTLGASGGLGTGAGVQGCESVAEQVPDFLVKPLILLNACFHFFQVVVLELPCHQLWVAPAPAACAQQIRAECPLAPLSLFPLHWPLASVRVDSRWSLCGLLVGSAEREPLSPLMDRVLEGSWEHLICKEQ